MKVNLEERNSPRIVLFDIETFANLGYVWGKYEQNVLDFECEWFILSVCYKYYGEDGVHSVSLPDFKSYKRDKTNDYYVVKALWHLFDEADVLVAHNGQKFDYRRVYARFLYHEMPPPSPVQIIDTLKVARKYFALNSYKLDDIGRFLGVGRKKVHTGWDLWARCRNGDPEAWEEMIAYNEQDVVLLERVYERFKPFITNHPNANLYQDTTHACPNCGSESLQKRGYNRSRVTKSQRYQCNECGAWSSGEKLVR